MWNEVVWIKTRPGFERLDRLIDPAGDVRVILFLDVESLALTDSIAQLVSLLHVLFRLLELFLVDVVNTDARVGHREVWIELDGALVECQRLAGFSFGSLFVAHRKRFQRFEGRRSRLLDTHIVLLNRAQRLPKFLSQI